jgi:fatty acid desaturase
MRGSLNGDEMSEKKIDRVKAESALEVVRESPAIALITVAPALVVFGVVWWLFGFWSALVLAVVLGVVAVVGRKLF